MFSTINIKAYRCVAEWMGQEDVTFDCSSTVYQCIDTTGEPSNAHVFSCFQLAHYGKHENQVL